MILASIPVERVIPPVPRPHRQRSVSGWSSFDHIRHINLYVFRLKVDEGNGNGVVSRGGEETGLRLIRHLEPAMASPGTSVLFEAIVSETSEDIVWLKNGKETRDGVDNAGGQLRWVLSSTVKIQWYVHIQTDHSQCFTRRCRCLSSRGSKWINDTSQRRISRRYRYPLIWFLFISMIHCQSPAMKWQYPVCLNQWP